MACPEGPALKGMTFRAEESFAFGPCESRPESRFACVLEFTFSEERLTAKNASGQSAQMAYRQCGTAVSVSFDATPGVAEVHTFAVQGGIERLIHVASGRTFRRVTPK